MFPSDALQFPIVQHINLPTSCVGNGGNTG